MLLPSEAGIAGGPPCPLTGYSHGLRGSEIRSLSLHDRCFNCYIIFLVSYFNFQYLVLNGLVLYFFYFAQNIIYLDLLFPDYSLKFGVMILLLLLSVCLIYSTVQGAGQAWNAELR